jgi:nickel/cobalt transporter (NicO) family protein
MSDLSSLIQSGGQNLWLFVPSAILLGALHGLEPGHSKTMMAAFIIAVRGTVGQAIMLGLAATVSHTAIVWLVALGGLHFGQSFTSETTEPYLQLVSGLIIVALAGWMVWRTTEDRNPHRHGSHGHHGSHGSHGSHGHHHDVVNTGDVAFEAIRLPEDAYSDAHARMHAEEIERRFAGRSATTGQIILFGLTGGLIPCPASVTVLLVCLQLKQISMGALLVLCFSIGLALTMVGVGAAAAIGVRHASGRFKDLSKWADNAPYLSGGLVALVGLYTLYLGINGIPAISH